MRAHPFELLELPDGRWYVVKPLAEAAPSLMAGSFAPLAARAEAHEETPVGCYATRDAAERAIQRAATFASDPFSDPLSMFADWLPKG